MQKRVLIVDTTLGENLQYSLQNEGCEVFWQQPMLYTQEVPEEPYFLGLGLNKYVFQDGKIIKVGQSWYKYIDDVDFIVFTDVSLMDDQQYLRKKGYKVICGGDQEELETKRSVLKNFYKEIGQKVLPQYWTFNNSKEQQEFVKEKKIGVVFKSDTQLQHNEKYATRVLKDWEVQYEVLSTLGQEGDIILEEYIDGWEIAVGGFFDGKEFLSPVLYNIEDKTLLPYEFQPLTGEMGTVVWYYHKNTRMFKEILEPLEQLLRELEYVGYFDINCIYSPNHDRIYVLEATQRFGYPLQLIQQHLHKIGFYEIFKMMYGLRPKEEFQFTGVPIQITDTKEDQENIKKYKNQLKTLYIAVGVCSNQEGYPYQSVLEKSQHMKIFGIDNWFKTKVKSVVERNKFLGGLPLIDEVQCVNPFGVYVDNDGKFRVNPGSGRLFVFTGISQNGIISEQLLNQLVEHKLSKIYIQGECIRDDIGVWKTTNKQYNFKLIFEKLFAK